jgi:hypothetical protein
MNNNISNNYNDFHFNRYSVNAEQLKMQTKEQLIQNILMFTDNVNNDCESLIEFFKRAVNPSIVDTNTNEFNKVVNHEKTSFEAMGINSSTSKRLQRSINSSKSEVFKKKATFELAKDNYTKECIKLHALRKVNVMFMNALKVREQINEDKGKRKQKNINPIYSDSVSKTKSPCLV